MDQRNKSSNKITEIVRMQQMLKKWKKLAVTPKCNSSSTPSNTKKSVGGFLKRTLSITDASSAGSASGAGAGTGTAAGAVPKGYLAVCVGEELKRFVIPTEYLSHRAFVSLLQEAEEEFGFQQEGVLRIPCEVAAFESILKVVEDKNKKKKDSLYYCSSEAEFAPSQQLQKPMCS